MRKLTITKEDVEKAIEWRNDRKRFLTEAYCAHCPISYAIRREWKLKPSVAHNGRLTHFTSKRQYYTNDRVAGDVIDLFDSHKVEELRRLLPVTITAHLISKPKS